MADPVTTKYETSRPGESEVLTASHLPVSPTRARTQGLWRLWFVRVTLGEFLGFCAPALAGALVADSGAAITLATVLVAGAVEGSVLGYFQAVVLRTVLRGLRTRDWMAATAVGAIVAWSIGLIPMLLGDRFGGLPIWAQVPIVAAGALIMVFALGVAQWTILRHFTDRAVRWVWGTAVAWIAGLAAFTAVATPLWHPGQSTPLIVAIGILGGLVMAAVVAAVTGAFLTRVLVVGHLRDMDSSMDVHDARWIVRTDPLRPSISDSAVFTIGAGGIATSGAVEEAGIGSAPRVLVAGVYAGTGPEQQLLLQGPGWTGVGIDPPPVAERFLDLFSGVLYRIEPSGEFHGLRFACAQRPGVMVMRIDAAPGRMAPGPPLSAPPTAPSVTAHDVEVEPPAHAETRGLQVESADGGAIAAVAAQQTTVVGDRCRLDRVAVFAAAADTGSAVRELRHAWGSGVDELLAGHRETWARRWSTVGIELPDDPETELAVRFALFQLWSNAAAHGESAVGARGVSGSGYRGHVFWDADVFVLPAMVSIDPEAARAMITYRLRRLAAAQQRAHAQGYSGARFPWESAANGADVTPRVGFLGGAPIPILTGTSEEHITADVPWAADHYAEWTGRPDFVETTARGLVTETARYWASRLHTDSHGRVHLRQVIGPDEYHESVDDNAFTNVMARWNLRRGARLEPRNPAETTEYGEWGELADRIVDQLHPDGLYEQFTGYFDLEPLIAAAVARPPLAADVLLGQHRVSGSQLIKQPDVLMLHHMVPDEVAPDSLVPNLDFYGPRTTHGSSLSPAVMAALLARAGRPDEALEMLRSALLLDLEDRSGSTASGLHLATLGGVWQAILAGFAGVRVRRGVLEVRPVLPARWSRLGLAFHCLGRQVRLDITPAGTTLHVDGPMTVAVGEHPARPILTESFWPAMEKKQP